MGDATWLADVLRGAGLAVAEVDGWQTRRRPGSPAELDPQVVVGHHTAGATDGELPSLRILRDGRADLNGPLCNVGLGRSGTFYVIAAGPANNAGTGGWAGFSGNYRTIGIEAENDGYQPWPDVQLTAYRIGSAAILRHLGLDASRWCRHHEWASYKPDPHDIDGDEFRTALGHLLAGDGAPLPLVPAAEPDGGARRTLYRGMTGDDVRQWQTLMGGAGMGPGPADGQYGPRTEAATRSWQRAAGLVADGIVGPLTWASMDRALAYIASMPPSSPPAAPDRPTIRNGSSGGDVRYLQGKLGQLGYAPGHVDGKFGPNTESAVRAFQHDHGLSVDGIVGPQTWGALG